MKIAIVHDWLTTLGGAERVLMELHRVFPQAPIFTLFADKRFISQHLPDADVRQSDLSRIPGIKHIYPYVSGLMPAAVESLDLSDYDTVISSSVFFSKGLVVKPRTRHICYCFSPTRPLWDRAAEYERTSWPSRAIRHILRIWDRHAADRVDQFVAISEHVKKRIQKYYQRDALVIYPPLSLAAQDAAGELPLAIPKPFYLIVSRLHTYKNVHIAVDTFNKLGYTLVIVGTGPAQKRLERMAKSNIWFLGFQDDKTVAALYANCRAFIMPQEEDFGLTALEAMNAGKPVLALRRGGALETVVEGVTGEFFDDPIPEGLADGVRRLNDRYDRYDASVMREHARRFSDERFRSSMHFLVYGS